MSIVSIKNRTDCGFESYYYGFIKPYYFPNLSTRKVKLIMTWEKERKKEKKKKKRSIIPKKVFIT